MNPQGRIVYVNEAACRSLAYSREELLSLSLPDIDPLWTQAVWEEGWKRTKQVGSQALESKHRNKQGKVFPVEVSANYVQFGGKEYSFAFARDITERKRAEESLSYEKYLLQAVMDNLPDRIYFKDRESRFTRINQAIAKRFGLSDPAQAIGKSDVDFFPTEDASGFFQDEQEILRTGQPIVDHEETATWPDGQTRWTSTTKMPLRDAAGNIVGTFGVSRDITERKRIEQELRNSEERFRSLFENATVGIYRTMPDGQILMCNPTMLHMLGYERFEDLGPRNLETDGFDPGYSRQMFKEKIERDGVIKDLESSWLKRDGSTVFVRESARAIRGPDGQVVCYDGIVEDITERKKAEEEARFKTTLLEAEAETTLDGILIVDQTGQVLLANRRMCEIWNIPADAPRTGHHLKFIEPILELIEDRETFLNRVNYLYAHPAEKSRDEIKFKDGRVFDRYSSPLLGPEGQYCGRIWYLRDVTESKRAEEAIRENQRQMATLIQASNTGLWDWNLQTNKVYYSPEWKSQLGYRDDEISDRFEEWESRVHPGDRKRALATIRAYIKEPWPDYELECRLRHKDGSYCWILAKASLLQDESGHTCRMVGSHLDITERRRMEESLRQSEERFRTLIERAPLAIGIGRDGLNVYANHKYLEVFGFESVAELMGLPIADQWAPEYRQLIAENARKRSLGFPVSNHFEAVAQRRDGTHFPAQVDVTMVTLPDGPATLAFLTDITERKRAEEALAASEARFRNYFEQPLLGAAITSLQKGWIAANDRLCEILGYSLSELQQTDWAQLTHPDDLEADVIQFNRVLAGEIDRYSLDKRFIRKDGAIIWTSIAVSCVRKPDGTVDYICCVLDDITERKRAEAKIRESEEKFRKAFMTEADALFIATLHEGRLLEVNDRFEDIFGYSRKESIGKTSVELGLFVNPAERQKMVSRLKSDGRVSDMEFRGRRKDGRAITVLVSVSILEGGAAQLILGVIRDVTEQKQAHEALVRLRQAANASGEVIFMTDAEGNFTFVNPEFTHLYGYTEAEVLGKATPRILKSGAIDATHYAQFWETLRKKQVARGEIINKTKQGNLVTLASSVSPVLNEAGEVAGYLAIQRDVTERKRLEQQYLQAQKMEAVGRLAAGVAHDFNNLLTIINGYSGMLLERKLAEDRRREALAEIKSAGERATGLTRQLLAFSRQEIRTVQLFDLNSLITDSVKMLRRLIGEDVELTFKPAEGLDTIKADPGQIEQALMNLAVNARDAMPKGGRLTIETANFVADQEFASSHYPMSAGPYVVVAVSDTGHGMDAVTQARIFEPFFTTKERSKGTGLGLATVYGIVKQNNGHIWVYSEVGQGTTFRIYLPAAAGTVRAPEVAKAASGGTETVLLVEDEKNVRALARTILESRGYNVLEAPTSMEALLIPGQYKDPIHLLLTDVVMPVMNGREVAEKLTALRPEMKVLYMSGYTDDTVVRHGVLEAGVAFLQKPFSPESLAQKVREVLDSPRSNS
jgi:PAS domain S-box-containing protein